MTRQDFFDQNTNVSETELKIRWAAAQARNQVRINTPADEREKILRAELEAEGIQAAPGTEISRTRAAHLRLKK